MNRNDDRKTALVRAPSAALARTGPQALARRGLCDLDAAERVRQGWAGKEYYYVAQNRADWHVTKDSEVGWLPESRPDGMVLLRTPELLCGVLRGPFFSEEEAEKFADEKRRGNQNEVVRLPRIVPHLWTGPDDVAHGFPPGCSFCGESDSAQYGKPCPKRSCDSWYEILGVAERADQNQIENAYRELLKELNPKRLQYRDDILFWGPDYPESQTKWLNAAYAVLNDRARRKQYDAELLQQHLSDPEWWTSKGNLLDSQGRHSEALECHDKALAIGPLCRSAWINKGLCLGELGRLADAIECYEKALAIDGSNYLPLVAKGDILDRMGRHVEAIPCFDAALKLSANLISAWEGKGQALDHLGRYPEAIACYDEVLKIDKPGWTEFGRASVYSWAWNLKGGTFSHAHRFQDAIECYDRAISIYAKDACPYYNKGIAIMKTGHPGEAISWYDKALQISPGHAESWHNKGICLRDLGRAEEAIACYERALACDPPEVLAWHSKAQALEDLGRPQDAINSYGNYLAVASADADHQVNVKHARARLRDLKRE